MAQLSGRRMLELILKTWPFIRPMFKHLLCYFGSFLVVMVIYFGGLAIGTDLFSNKILVGAKLQPVQAWLLGVDDSYVTEGYVGWLDDNAAPVGDDKDREELSRESVDEDERLTDAQRKTVRNRFIIWGALASLMFAAWVATLPYYSRWIWHRVNQDLRVAMIERAEHLSLRYHSQSRVGDAMYRVYRDSAMIISLVEQGLIIPLGMVFTVIMGMVVIAFFDPWVALMLVLIAIPILWITVVFTPRIRRLSVENRVANANLTSQLQETFSAIKVVKLNRAEDQILNRFNHDSHRALDAAFRLRMEIMVLMFLVALLGGTTLFIAEYIMVSWVIDERDTFLGAMVAAFIGFTVWNLGAFQSAIGRVEEINGSGHRLVQIWSVMQDLFIGLERAFFLLELEPEVEDPPSPVDFPEHVEQVMWRDVHFAYGEQPVLKGVDLVAKPGTITAIVGTTGSGKSTLMSMLLRLYDPDKGMVSINDVDLRALRIDDIRSSTAIALQRNVLFAASVEDNIRYASKDASIEDIEAAARVAMAHDFIKEMPLGYDTELGERGGKLSTGQRQRLSIARAIVRDKSILILDEPTASLDAKTEHQVLANLSAWGRERVMFIVTHRLSTIRNADQIAFLEDGRIVEQGTHDELMALSGGRYRRFIEAESGGIKQDD